MKYEFHPRISKIIARDNASNKKIIKTNYELPQAFIFHQTRVSVILPNYKAKEVMNPHTTHYSNSIYGFSFGSWAKEWGNNENPVAFEEIRKTSEAEIRENFKKKSVTSVKKLQIFHRINNY